MATDTSPGPEVYSRGMLQCRQNLVFFPVFLVCTPSSMQSVFLCGHWGLLPSFNAPINSCRLGQNISVRCLGFFNRQFRKLSLGSAFPLHPIMLEETRFTWPELVIEENTYVNKVIILHIDLITHSDDDTFASFRLHGGCRCTWKSAELNLEFVSRSSEL